MSVIANYARVSAEGLASLRSNSVWIEALETDAIPDAEIIDIDKTCDGIVWLLSRLPPQPSLNVEGAGFVLRKSLAPLLSGQTCARESELDAPYGPASSLSVQQVGDLSAWLQSIDPAQLRNQYEPRAMAADHVYPQIWIAEGIAAFDGYLLPWFLALRDFFARARQNGQQVLVFFS
jgi:hypothetical protein